MNQKSFARWLKCITVVIASALALFFFFLVPQIGRNLVKMYPSASFAYEPFVASVTLAAIPCGAALVLFWRICTNIARDNSFCAENARFLRGISRWALADVVWCIAVTTVFVCLNVFHFTFVIAAFFLVLVGAAIAIAAAALSHLTKKAARMKEENDLTV